MNVVDIGYSGGVVRFACTCDCERDAGSALQRDRRWTFLYIQIKEVRCHGFVEL